MNSAQPTLGEALDRLKDSDGRSLRALCEDRPGLVALLRHTGCTFCRQTLSDLGERRAGIERAGVGIILVGMSDSPAPLEALAQRFGLTGVPCVADPDRLLYRALDLKRGRIRQLFGPRVIFAGFAGLIRGLGVGRPEGDPYQMPGTAVIHRGRVLRSAVHHTAASRPDYEALACGLSP